MDAYEAIIGKRDTRSYLDKPLPDDVLRRILQAGRMAGSSKNTQPCRFVVLRDRERLAEFAACGQFAQHLPSAAAAVAICLPQTGSDFDAGRAAQNIMVAAWAQGVASCPVSLHDQPCAVSTLGLPQGYRVVVAIALGYPDPSQPLSAGRARLPLDDYVHHDRWSAHPDAPP